MPVIRQAAPTVDEVKNQRTIDKYLENYAEPESKWQSSVLEQFAPERWSYVVTIPACGEYEYLPGALSSIVNCHTLSNKAKVLCIIVLNGNEAREVEFKASNKKMRDWFSMHTGAVVSGLNPDGTCPQSLVSWRGIEVLIVDRSRAPWLIPSDQGVGMVRKIGADIALMLMSAGKIADAWIHNTDADARVPDDYFLRTSEQIVSSAGKAKKASCYIYPYQHIPDANMAQQEHNIYWPAVIDYELWLRYYVAGLQWAGSCYAYPSIGSLLACHSLAYARTRGFPKKLAGEDFYFQNKLAKMGAMINLKGEPIRLLTRPSSRVPFGTGQGTIKISQLNQAGQQYEVYHPLVFDFLKGFLAAAGNWINTSEKTTAEKELVFYNTMKEYLPCSEKEPEDPLRWLQNLLMELQVFKNLHAAEKRSKSSEGAIQQFDDWFDGFRTLKLIHRLRDEMYGSLPLIEALQASSFLKKAGQTVSKLDGKNKWLERLRDDVI